MKRSQTLGRAASMLILAFAALGCGGSAPAPSAGAPAASVTPAPAPTPEPPDAPDINIGSGGTTINGNAVSADAALNGLNLLSPKVFGTITTFTLQLKNGTPFAVTDVQIPFAAGTLDISGSVNAAVAWKLGTATQSPYDAATYGGEFQWPANLISASATSNLSYTANGTVYTTPIANLQNIELKLSRP